jgi:hypothetical protein
MRTVGWRWMFDRLACAKVRVADAHVDLTALTNLVALLGHVLNDRFTPSNAPLSGVSLLSATRIGESSMPRQMKPARRFLSACPDFAGRPGDAFAGSSADLRTFCHMRLNTTRPNPSQCRRAFSIVRPGCSRSNVARADIAALSSCAALLCLNRHSRATADDGTCRCVHSARACRPDRNSLSPPVTSQSASSMKS